VETDKQVYRVFGAQPDWVFQLAGLPPVGKCVMRSFTVKSLERRTDAVIVPEALDQPLWVVEFQFGENPFIYTRTVQKMAAIQEEFDLRDVRGIIFFAEQRFDPQTQPWTSNVRSIVLIDELRRLAQRTPDHPLVAVFQPLLAERDADLEHAAGGFYLAIKNSKLKKGVKETLEEVFVSWLLQRLPDRSKQEIEKMLIGELPELVDTRAGRDILKIGEERGRAEGRVEGLVEGLVEAVVILLESKRGRLSKGLRQRIGALGAKQLRQLLAEAGPWESLAPLDAWLGRRGK